ncbi:MAG: tetratricopeptide repeat protein [Bacteroidia bacterium]|nr:tetratricopeptide repeat protein [Bacteroidia bacterium]
MLFNSEQTAEKIDKLILRKYELKDSIKLNWIASKINKKEKKILFYHTLGEQFYDADDYDAAKYFYTKSVALAKLTLNKKLIADELSLLGDIYRLQDQNTIALQLLFQSMYMYKELNDYKKLTHTLSLIGDINRCLDQHTDALKYLNESLTIAHEYHYDNDKTFCYSSIGGTYHAKKDYENAAINYMKGLTIARMQKDTMRIVDLEHSLGDLLIDQNKIAEALVMLNDATLLCLAINDKFNLVYCYIGTAKAYLKQKQYQRAIDLCLKGYEISKGINVIGLSADVSEVLHEAYYYNNDMKNAYMFLKILNDNRDSTINSEQIKQQAQVEITFKNSYKEKQDSLVRAIQQEQKDMAHQAALKHQKIIAIAGVIGLIMAATIAFIVFRFYQKEKKSKHIIHEQKILVDEKNKEIVDSINYAKKIQQAIVPGSEEIISIFPNSFVLLLPKDIVSGDFYWVAQTTKYNFFAVIDCTGHGVPGGFMSMLGMALLNEIVNEKNIYEPADILNLLKIKIISVLRQSDNVNENKDGMDISLCRIDKKHKEVVFAGANNSLYIIRKNTLTEYKGDKHPIGYSFETTNKPFSQQCISLEKNDFLYMFTDGLPDQFGGPQGKKYKYKALEQLLIDIHNLNPIEQKSKILETHLQWKGNLEQVDDICIAGIQV